MKPRTETNGAGRLESFVRYFGAIMALIYVVAGIFLLLKANVLFNMPRNYSMPLGIILTLYGMFRSYRVYKKYFETHYEKDN